MTGPAPGFFMPDGNGGSLQPDRAEEVYATVRAAAESGFWGGTFTWRRVYELVSEHNGERYVNRVGELTKDRKGVLGIFQSLDERGRERYVVQSIYSTIHVDASKVVSVLFFDGH